MNAERLLAHYERLADAPDAIQRLRRFVLDLAVRGKLVPQDPKDEPASELLKRIAAEKARRVKQGATREQKPLPPIMDEEIEFDLSGGWQCARMADLIKLWNGFAFKSADFKSRRYPRNSHWRPARRRSRTFRCGLCFRRRSKDCWR